MLKIEKANRHSSEITLEFRKKEIFFNQIFVKALSLAFGLHFAAFLIFHIGPFKLVNNGFLPPSFVETDVFEGQAEVATNIQGKRKISRIPFAPTISTPKLPSIPHLKGMQHLENIEDLSSLDNPFFKVERDLRNNLFFSKDDIKQDKPALELFLSGKIANKKIEDLNKLTPPFNETFHAIYNVNIENKTGRIFFVDSENTILSHTNNKIIVEFLKELRFEKEYSGFVTSGQIEIIVNHEGFDR